MVVQCASRKSNLMQFNTVVSILVFDFEKKKKQIDLCTVRLLAIVQYTR